jgi:acetyl esterase
MGRHRLSGLMIGLLAGLMAGTGALAETITPTSAEQQQIDALKQDEAWFIAHLKGPREVADGFMLDARLQYVLENVTRPSSTPQVQAALRAMYATPAGLAAVRAQLDRYWALRTKITPDMKRTQAINIPLKGQPDIKARLLIPNVPSDKPLPMLIYYHGGGFMFGSADGFERTAQLIANEGKTAVLIVDYRLAPESPYPAAWSDAEATYGWALKQGQAMGFDAKRIALGGDSAGATLAIAVALRAKKAGKRMPKALLLYYPGVDRVNGYPSMDQFGKGYGLDADNLQYLAKQVYPEGVQTTSEDTSAMQADLKGLPATFVVMVGFDPLKDGQKAFSDKLQASGATTTRFLYPTLIHGFLQTSAYVPDADKAATETAKAFGEAMRAK